ncbi:MAG: DUF2330 domain-containing protein [Candidatus Dormibacteria bacterium]
MRRLAVLAIAGGALAAQTVGAAACGGLVAPNGAIRLTRATTYVDWRGGVEHYLTSFAYQGTAFSDFGWIVPLPAAPDKVEEGGGWTLQRLNRETHPQPQFDHTGGTLRLSAGTAAPAEILLKTSIRALDITVLKGSGEAITTWCKANGFLLTPETKAHLEVYAGGSPVFMAAKYNVTRAEGTRQLAGDGAPVLITMHLPHLWIPLEVLANGTSTVGADIYITGDRPVYASEFDRDLAGTSVGNFVPGALGLAVRSQQPVSSALFRDLSSDKNMSWLKPAGWLTYLTLDAPASTVSYDMGISSSGVIHVAPFGTPPMKVADYRVALPQTPPAPGGASTLAWVSLLISVVAALGGAAFAGHLLRQRANASL